ncbi:MAG: GNAT family N-acetyltransferase [Planctomycetes bacterium]|nr:GNAT family N-acetyltransferase [Planctomycetota bacterium]
MPASATCRLLEWDSEFFGLRVASFTPPALTNAVMLDVVTWCRAQRIDCLYVRSDSGDTVGVRLLEDAGARAVDVRMTFERNLLGLRSVAHPAVRTSRESDIPALRELAAVSHTNSRFWADERFPRERCAELYATWIEKSCRGWADRVLVAELDERPAGYLSCHLRERCRGEIGIVAVAPFAQSRGLGGALLDSALAWLAEQGVEHVTVVTQGRNAAAQRLYQSRGFLTASVQVWHHLWFKHDEPRT